MIFRKILSVIFCLAGFHISIFAGGWPQPKGGYFIKLSEWWIVSDQHFDFNGEVHPNLLEFGYYSTNLYAEYGFTDRTTAILYFPFLNYAYSIPPSSVGKQSIWALGDPDIALKYALVYQKPIALSVTFLSGLPLGKDRESGTAGLQTGDGEWNQALILDAGTGYKVSNSTGWVNLYGGYNLRTGYFDDELLYGIEGGIHLAQNKITIAARVAGIKALGDPANALYINPQSLFSNHKEYVSLSPELSYHLGRWGVTIGVGTALSGQNIFANTTFTIGVFYKRYRFPD